MPDDRETNLDFPASLQAALNDLHRAPAVPSELDDRILFAARDGFARRLRTRMLLRRTAAAGGAVAAAIAIFFGVQAMQTRPAANPQVTHLAPPQAVDGDVDGNGQVDIVDALLLAKRVEANDAAVVIHKWEDLDRDGRLTRADVEQVAQLAVRLPNAPAAGGTLQ